MDPSAQHRQVIQEYVQAFNAGDFAAVARLFTPDGIVHGVLGQGGLEVARPIWEELHRAFHLHLEIQDIVAEGARVAVRFLESGTFTAPFRGLAPTGRSYQLTAMEFFLFENGRIQERWGARDSASMLRQLGVTAQPG